MNLQVAPRPGPWLASWIVLCLALPCGAEEEAEGRGPAEAEEEVDVELYGDVGPLDGPAPWEWSGSAHLGYRSLSEEGSDALYRTLVDRDEGLRLFSLDLAGTTGPRRGPVADTIRLSARGFGGEPERLFRFELARRGAYRIRLGVTQVDSIFDVPSWELGQHGHDRERQTVEAGVTVYRPRGAFWLSLRRNENEGPGTSTQIVGSNEFLLEHLLDRRSDVLRVGGRFRAGPVTFTLEQAFTESERDDALSLAAGAEEGNQGSSELERWLTDERTRSTGSITSLAFHVPFKARAELSGRLTWSQGDVDSTHDRDSRQVRPGPPSGIERRLLSTGDVDRRTRVGELGFTVQVTDRLALHDTLRLRAAESDGDLAATETVLIGTRETVTDVVTLTRFEEDSFWNELSLTQRLPRRVVLHGGIRSLRRDVSWRVGDGEQTDAAHDDNRLFMGVSWRPGSRVHVHGELSVGDQDRVTGEPVVLLRREPLDTRSASVRASFRPSDTSSLGVSLKYRHGDNPQADEEHHEDLLGLAITGSVRVGNRFELHGTLSRLRQDASSLLDVTVDGARVKPRQLYRLRQTALSLRSEWRPAERVSLHLRLSGVSASGSLPSRWYEIEPTLAVRAPRGYEWRLGWTVSRYERDDVGGEDFRHEALVAGVVKSF